MAFKYLVPAAAAALALLRPSDGAADKKRPSLVVVTKPEPAEGPADRKNKKTRRPLELLDFERKTVKRFVRPRPDPTRAEEFRVAHLEWKAAMARRNVARLSPHDEQNVEMRRILRKRNANGRPIKG